MAKNTISCWISRVSKPMMTHYMCGKLKGCVTIRHNLFNEHFILWPSLLTVVCREQLLLFTSKTNWTNRKKPHNTDTLMPRMQQYSSIKFWTYTYARMRIAHRLSLFLAELKRFRWWHATHLAIAQLLKLYLLNASQNYTQKYAQRKWHSTCLSSFSC